MLQRFFSLGERVTISRPLIWFIVLVVVGCLYVACQDNKQTVSYMRLEGNAQGTTFTITYDDALNRDFSKAVDSLFRIMDHSMSVWDENSIVTAANAGKDVELDEHFIRVFNKGKEIHDQTRGAFDMTVGPLVRRWGFSFKKNQEPPDSIELRVLMESVGMEKAEIKDGKLVKAVPNMEIDFNAIAQGYSVDLIADFLEKNGVKNYYVEVGGEVKVKGHTERNSPWNIAIDKPVADLSADGKRQLQCIVPMSDKSMATSGSYRKFVERTGRKYSHAIDPKTGQPVQHNLLSVSVMARGCMEADAYATAFLVLGLEATKNMASELGLEVFCIFENEDGSLGVYASPGLEYQGFEKK